MRVATNNDLQLNTKNMQRYISGPTTLTTMLCMLQDEMDRGFRTIYPKAMDARASFNEDVIKQ